MVVLFQEKITEGGITRSHTTIPRTKSRCLDVKEQEVRPLSIDVKKEPPLFEERVQCVVMVRQNDYIDPFSIGLDTLELLNLSSGVAVSNDKADSILNIFTIGKSSADEFRSQRLINTKLLFHQPIKRKPLITFKDTSKSVTVQKGNQTVNLTVNRNIIATLLSHSARSKKVIDFESALKYPLSATPLSIAIGDGSRRETSKSKLMNVIKPVDVVEPAVPSKETVSDFIVDLMALVRTQSAVPRTFEEFFWKRLPVILL